MAVLSGCSFHRTAHGFVLRSGQWSLERNRVSPDLSVGEASERPEVLPWRSRLRGYRLARIFRDRDSAGEAPASSQGVEEPHIPQGVIPLSGTSRPDLVVE